MSDLKEMIRQANETAVNKLKTPSPTGWISNLPMRCWELTSTPCCMQAHPLRGRRCAAPCAEPLLPY